MLVVFPAAWGITLAMRPRYHVRRVRRFPFLVLAYGCIGAGALGVVLPLLPTTPFLLVAAWAAPKGSPALNRWLHRHPHFGPVLVAWRREGAVSVRAKWLACLLLAVSWVIIYSTAPHPLAAPVTAAMFAVIALFVTTRPTPGAPY
jgi:uncharacterized protein